MACFRHLWAPRHVNPRIQDIQLKYGNEITVSIIVTAIVIFEGNKEQKKASHPYFVFIRLTFIIIS